MDLNLPNVPLGSPDKAKLKPTIFMMRQKLDSKVRDCTCNKKMEPMCMFDKFHVTFNLKTKVSRDVFKNKNECQLTSTFYSKMSPQFLTYTIF